MATVFVRFHVRNFDIWKSAFDASQDRRAQGGFTGHSVGRDPADANLVVIALRTSDLERALEYATSDYLREVMQQSGVEGVPESWFTEDVEEMRY